MDIVEWSEKLELVSKRYARRNAIERNPDWFVHKINEEFGELTQAFLRKQGQARAHDLTSKQIQENFEDEYADVLGHVLIFAINNDIDIMSAMERKWLHYLDLLDIEECKE